MRIKKKIFIFLIIMFIVLFILPFILINISKSHEFMGIMIMLFFVVNPITAAIINSMIGKDIRKMWWMPVLFSIVFLLAYWIVLKEIILDLMFYAVIYLIIGLLTSRAATTSSRSPIWPWIGCRRTRCRGGSLSIPTAGYWRRQ